MTDRPPVDRRTRPRSSRLWEKVRDNARHLQARMEAEWERLRVNRALGRRARVPVHDTDLRLIVDRGEPVTRVTVARARQSGVLERVLESVDGSDHRHSL